MSKNKKTIFTHLGEMDYQQAWDFQTTLFEKTVQQKIENRKLALEQQSPTNNYLLFVYHPHVFTLGKSGKIEHLLLTDQELKEKEATFYHINRGGDITYHGPGQIVGYPILDLDNFFTDIHQYLRFLEESVILTLKDFGITAGRVEGLTGVWVDFDVPEKARKICALGVKSSRWVTMHGFAFNVNVDLNYFNHIIPCGIPDKAVTSMEKELGKKQDMYRVEEILKTHISRVFGMEMIA